MVERRDLYLIQENKCFVLYIYIYNTHLFSGGNPTVSSESKKRKRKKDLHVWIHGFEPSFLLDLICFHNVEMYVN